MKDLLIKAGFTDIVENDNGTFDATLDGKRYGGLYMSGFEEDIADNDVIESVPCTFSLSKGAENG